MSDNTALAELGQEIIAQYSQSLIASYVQLFAAVLVFYDFLLTYSRELLLIWNGKANLMKALFFVNRYGGLIYQFTNVSLYFWKPALNAECSTFNYMNNISDALCNVAIYSIFTLRTFAIYERSWTVFFFLAIPALVDVAANIWYTYAQTASAFPRQLQVGPNTCEFNDTSSVFATQLTSDISAALFDALVVILTVRRTYRLAKCSREANIRRSLSYVLLRDGIIYYIAIFLPVFGSIAFDAVLLNGTGGNVNLSSVANNFSAMFLAIRNVAVNRLILSLSHAANSRDDLEYRSRTGLEPPAFTAASVLGNIGGLVRSGLDEMESDATENDPSEEMKIDHSTKLDV